MRINAERERIFRFKSIAKDTATQYYTILDRFAQELLNPKSSNLDGAHSPLLSQRKPLTADRSVAEDNKEAGSEKEESSPLKRGQNFKQVMGAAFKENQLHNAIRFVTDYLR